MSKKRDKNLVGANVNLIDFGLSRKYMAQKKHVPNTGALEKQKSKNVFFASKNYFNGDTLSRRDDITEIIYNLMYLADPYGSVLSQAYKTSETLFDDISNLKLNSTAAELCASPRTQIFGKILEEAYSYQYE